MIITATDANLTQIKADALVVGVFADCPPEGPASEVDRAAGGVLSQLIEREEITGKSLELVSLFALPGVAAEIVLVVGLGAKDDFDRGTAFRAAAAAARQLAGKERTSAAFCLVEAWSDDLVESAAAGAVVGCHGQDLYKAEKKRHPFDEIIFAQTTSAPLTSGQILGESVNLTRRLVNEPAGKIYPESFAEAAQDVADECNLEIEIWDEDRLAEERCGALLAVGQGSGRPPRLVILRYDGGQAEDPPLALVGKGVTFDSGGLSLKTGDHMKDMKLDMAGAATVVGAMRAIALLKLPLNVIGLAGLVENLPGGRAYKVGDVLTARNGRTIEVLNTDAEGRLVLADALSVAVDRSANRVIDLATLTGACVVALGTDVAGMMTNDQPWCDAILDAAKACGERAWQLPMFPEYAEQIKGEVADIKNLGEGRWGGAITAAKFLEEFVGETPWTHVDIAGPAFLEKNKPYLDGGGTGAFVRTLVEVARRSGEWGVGSGE